MNKFYLFRQTTRIVGILSCIAALIAVKNRCPFCRKALMLFPLKGQEFCPHCGCQVH